MLDILLNTKLEKMSKKILIIKTGALGDMILSSVSFKTIKKNFPHHKIYLLIKSKFIESVKDCPFFEKIFILPDGRNPVKFLNFLLILRKEKFDKIFDIQGNLKTNFYSFLIGAREKIGFYRKKTGKLFLTKGIRKRDDLNPVKYQRYFFEKIGIKTDETLEIWIEKNGEYKEFLKGNGLKERNYVVIHPVASTEWKTKRWLPDRFAKLADILIEKGEKIVFIGKERNEIEEIIKKMRNKPLNLGDETDISQLIFLIKNSKIVITTDSAPLHIGAASKVKTVGIFGPTDPKRHCPPDVTYVYKKVECSPCYKKKCDKMICMKKITVEDIMEEITK